MNTIELALQPVMGFLMSINRNPTDGWYEIEVGLPPNWEFGENDEIMCNIISESTAGKLVKISPKKSGILIDDLVAFVGVIIDTNKKIADKEKEFTDKMQEMKNMLENEAKKFYDELDILKVDSFKTLNNNFVKHSNSDENKKVRKPRTLKSKNVKAIDEVVIKNTETSN